MARQVHFHGYFEILEVFKAGGKYKIIFSTNALFIKT
jgi:hypothetical protein